MSRFVAALPAFFAIVLMASASAAVTGVVILWPDAAAARFSAIL